MRPIRRLQHCPEGLSDAWNVPHCRSGRDVRSGRRFMEPTVGPWAGTPPAAPPGFLLARRRAHLAVLLASREATGATSTCPALRERSPRVARRVRVIPVSLNVLWRCLAAFRGARMTRRARLVLTIRPQPVRYRLQAQPRLRPTPKVAGIIPAKYATAGSWPAAASSTARWIYGHLYPSQRSCLGQFWKDRVCLIRM